MRISPGYGLNLAVLALSLGASIAVVDAEASTGGHPAQIPADAQNALYRVHLSFTRPLSAAVEARIAVPDGKLFMDPIGLDSPDGWAAYVKDLQVRDPRGKLLALKPGGRAEWLVDGGGSQVLEVRCRVDLSFALDKNNSGDLRMGKLVDDALFLVNRPLFVLSNAAGPRTIEYDVPANWKIASSWRSTGPRSFEARDNRDLAFNTTVYGRYATVESESGGVKATLALLGELGQASVLIGPHFRKILHEYLKLFPSTPPRHILMTFFYGVSENGEAFASSASLTLSDKIAPNSIVIWGNFLAHEMFHQWNGQQIRGANVDDRQWMSEGFTEYISNRTLIRTGMIPESMFIKRMEGHLGMYLYYNWAPPFARVSLKEAGAKKSYNRPGVYSGGWAAPFCLDMTMRRLTHNRRSIDDYFRLMYERFGLTGKAYAYEDIVSTASEAAGQDLSEFFAKFVSGTDQMPVLKCLRYTGYEGYAKAYAGEMYIFPIKAPTAAQRAVRASLLHGTPR